MAGSRVTSGVTVVGVAPFALNGEWTYVTVVNWGTAVIFAKALAGATGPADFAVSADDAFPVPVGQQVVIPVDGPPYDQGGIQGGGGGPVVTVKIACGTASSGFSVVGASTP